MSLTGFQRRRRELAAKKQAEVSHMPQAEQVNEAHEKPKRPKKGGERNAGG